MKTCTQPTKQLSYDELAAVVVQLQEENQWLKEQINLSRASQFGTTSETLSQICMFENTSPDTTEKPEVQDIPAHQRKKCSSKNGRNLDTSKLEREIIHHDLSEQEKQCVCGCQMDHIGSDHSEKIDYIPSQLKVIEHVAHKYACRQCHLLKQGKKPEHPLGKLMATVSFLVDIVLKKFQYHLPYYRQSKIFKHSHINIPDNTLANWVMKGGDGLLVLYEALMKEYKHTRRLQVDESPIRLLSQSKKGYVWCYHSYEENNRFYLYEIASNRSARVVNTTLEGYEGILHTDGYSSYNAFRLNTSVITPGCWSHVRRKFVSVVKSTSAGYAMASKIIRCIDRLFAIDAENKDDIDSRFKERQKESAPLVEEIKLLIDQAVRGPLRKGMMSEALTYITNQWKHLILFLTNADIELSTNWVENAIRPFALGRRNWLFINNLETGQITGLFYSLIQTCIANQIEPRNYLTYVFNQIPQLRRREVDPRSLLPQYIDQELLKNIK